MENNKLVIIEDGKEINCNIILNVEDIEGKNYVIYTKENDSSKCYASIYEEINGKYNLKPIKDEKIYKLLEEILNSIDNTEE